MKELNQSELEYIKIVKKDKKAEIYNKCMIEEEIENLKNEGKGDIK